MISDPAVLLLQERRSCPIIRSILFRTSFYRGLTARCHHALKTPRNRSFLSSTGIICLKVYSPLPPGQLIFPFFCTLRDSACESSLGRAGYAREPPG